MRRYFARMLSIVSGEFLLSSASNSGGIVLARALLTTLLIYFPTIGLREYLAPNASFAFDLVALQATIRDTLPWLGAIFVVSYSAFYSRFASQWTYLAGLYNQIMAALVQAPWDANEARRDAYVAWMAGFIEDAEDLHLARRPMYAAVIRSFLQYKGVRETYIANTFDGERRLADMESAIAQIVGSSTPPQSLLRDRSVT